jgi:hypothetical protein
MPQAHIPRGYDGEKKGDTQKKNKMSANDTLRGYVYCIAIDSHPGTVKIGATTRNPNERLREANACTWSPWPFRLVVAAEVPDVWATERLLHALLSARRINDRREFFTLTPDEASGLFAVLAPPNAPVLSAPSELSRATQSVTTPDALAVSAPSEPMCRRCNRRFPKSGHTASDLHSVGVATPGEKLRAWVDANYTRILLRQKDTGTKLDVLHKAYAATSPPVHSKMLGKILFGKMLNAVYPNIGPHRNTTNTTSCLYLVR